MIFSTVTFFGFFFVYILFHVAVPRKYRNYLIICGSTIFYAWWKLDYVWIPYVLMIVAFYGPEWMSRAGSDEVRRFRATTTIILLFLPLLFYKYVNFFYQDVFGLVVEVESSLFELPLPLGISFITFTLTAYIVDIYKGRFPAHQSFSTVLAYVLFFPHLIAGPILRPNELIPQLLQPKNIHRNRIALAVLIFSFGLAKKVVIADQVAESVDLIYGSGSMPTANEAWLAFYGFSVQIYCDFSGYTDMAIGLALLLGIRLPNNFAQPYTAASIIDFWRRWHITLSYWLRDYLYIPLGGNRGGLALSMRNVIITMALGGLWHGADWTFVIWGLMHGIGVSVAHLFRHARVMTSNSAVANAIFLFLTFHFVGVSWVFFRAPDFARAKEMFASLIFGEWTSVSQFASDNLFPILLCVVFFLTHKFDDHRLVNVAIRRTRPEFVWAGVLFLFVIAIAVNQGSSAKFIYFDF